MSEISNIEVDENLKSLFLEEVEELLSDTEKAILKIEKEPNNKEYISMLFRSVHSIKSACAMVKLLETQQYVHQIETVLSFLRDEKIEASPDFIDTILTTIDYVRGMTLNSDSFDYSDRAPLDVVHKLKTFIPKAEPQMSSEETAATLFKGKTFKLMNDIEQACGDLFRNPDNKKAIETIFRSFQRLSLASKRFEAKAIADFIDDIDPILQTIRTGSISASKEMAAALAESVKIIREISKTDPKIDQHARLKKIVKDLQISIAVSL